MIKKNNIKKALTKELLITHSFLELEQVRKHESDLFRTSRRSIHR